MVSKCYILFSDVTVIFRIPFITDMLNYKLLMVCGIIEFFFLLPFFLLFIGKGGPVKIQLPVHHPRNLQQDQKGMPGRFIILLVGNIAAIWATLIMVSVSVWEQAA